MTHVESAGRIKRVALLAGAALLFLVFCSLGTWQVKRLQWKLDLIERVETRAYSQPELAPGVEQWPAVQTTTHEYQRVLMRGKWLAKHSTFTQAVTTLGSGYWLLTPLETEQGFVVWINRGFVPPRFEDPLSKADPDATVQILGLLRTTEPDGGFLRKNDPAANRWYSRDITALNAQHTLGRAAPYFVDAQVGPQPLGVDLENMANASAQSRQAMDDSGEARTNLATIAKPVPGLTVLKFKNNHLMYAITWYALALMVAGITFWLMRRGQSID